MRRSVGIGLLMTLACPLVVAGKECRRQTRSQGCERRRQRPVAIHFVWDLVAGFLVMLCRRLRHGRDRFTRARTPRQRSP